MKSFWKKCKPYFDKKDLVIFDLDETLVKTERLHELSYYLAESFIWEDETLRYQASQDQSILYKTKCEFYLQLLESENLEFNEPIYEIYKAIKRTDKKMALATSTTSQNAKLILEKCKLDFDLVLTGDDFKENNKPSPDMFLSACEHFNISRYNTIIIEDSPNGFKAAEEANISYIDANNLRCQILL